MRFASRSSSVVSVPTQSSTSNVHVLRLEKSAEEMSQGGSDIGNEIWKMNELEKARSRSRDNSLQRQTSMQSENSIQRSDLGDAVHTGLPMPGRMGSSRSRASSYADSVGAARFGGYSPSGLVTSPVGSPGSGSGSWSHASMNRGASGSKSSRLAQMVEPMQEGRPLDSPLTASGSGYFPQQPSRQASQSSFAQHPSRQASQSSSIRPSRQASQSSFAQRYDDIAGQIEESLVHVPPSPPKHVEPVMIQEPEDIGLHSNHGAPLPEGATTPPDRPRSTDTFQEAQLAFKDFDGVHFSPGTDELVEIDENGNEIRRISARTSSGNLTIDAASLLRTPRARPMSYAAPPPGEDMVYYPAPVPRMLNLPKRLSQLPSANVQAQRRSQALGQLAPEVRKSAPWLPQMNFSDRGSQRSGSGEHARAGSGDHQRTGSGGSHSANSHPRAPLNERMSMANFHNLPPQLRASVFFDQQSLSQDVEVKSESAVATLDSILAASATAPVTAFTDHPFAGDVRKHTFAPEHPRARRSTATLASQATNAMLKQPEKEVKRRRSSLAGLLKRTSSTDELTNQLEKRGSRGTLTGLLKRTSSTDELANQLEKRVSRTSTLLDFNEGGNKLRKRKSQLSLADDLDRREDDQRPKSRGSEYSLGNGLVAHASNADRLDDEERERVVSGSRPATAMSSGRKLDDDDQIKEDWEEAEAEEDVNDEDLEPVFAQPTTLLAELQVRKAQQKSRNRTAATAYPNGMHSTLLQLDAVAEVQKGKRKNHKIALAWEGPNADLDKDDEEDDVPLGVLFPSKNGLVNRKMGDDRDWNRPLGLMAKRELEDNEPLSSRRNRMKGLPPSHGRAPSPVKQPGILPNASQLHLAGQPDAPPEGQEEDEREGETLGERLKRLRTKAALDGAIGDVAPKEGSRPVSTFTDDVLSQFGGLDIKDKDATAGAKEGKPADEEEETLGQRKARLAREREGGGGSREVSGGSNRPPLKTSNSLGNLLNTNPIGPTRQTAKQHQPAQGSLLHASQQAQANSKQQLLNTNMRSMSYGLVDARPNTSRDPLTGNGLLGRQASGQAPAGGFANGLYNNGTGMAQPALQTSASKPMMGMNGVGNHYFAPATMPLSYGQPTMGSYAQQQQQMMNPLAYNALTGGAPVYHPMMGLGGTYAYGAQMGGMNGIGYGGMGMPMAMEEPMTPQQRSAIDQWRMSVGQ